MDNFDNFKQIMDYWYNVRDEHKFKAIWSIYNTHKTDIPNCLDHHPLNPQARLVYKASHGNWGQDVESETTLGATWLDLYKVANDLIERSGDSHHQFIEGFRKIDDNTYSLVTGS